MRTRSQGCARASQRGHIGLAPSRRSTPSLWGNGREDEGRPGAQFHRDAERWLAPGLSDIVNAIDLKNIAGVLGADARLRYLIIGPLEPPPIDPMDGIAWRIGAGVLRNEEILPTFAVFPTDELPVGPPDLKTFKPPPPRPIT